MRNIYSDLIIESYLDSASPHHSFRHTEERHGIFSVISSESDTLSYKTVVTGLPSSLGSDEKRALCRLLGDTVTDYLDKCGLRDNYRTLVTGLGNPSVTSDSLGSLAVDRIFADGERVFTLRPLTKAKTGISSASLVRSTASLVSADVIIAVDSLAAKFPERLGTVVQITDSGITPGSGVSQATDEISRSTMPCPVISLGVPTVIRSDLFGKTDTSLLVTPASVDAITESFSSLIAAGINLALAGNIT